MAICGIIFDCDGTLVDSETLAAQLLQQLLAEQLVHMAQSEVLTRFRGIPFSQFLSDLGALYPTVDTDTLATDFRQQSLPLLRDQVTEMPGAVAFVQGLTLPMCVASNGPRDKIETNLQAVGLLADFSQRIVSAYEVNAWKPSPVLIEHAARLLGVPVHECLLVDDSVPGVQAGLAAGAQVAGYGETDFAQFGECANFYRVGDFVELGELLRRLE